MIRTYATFARMTHPEERAALHNARIRRDIEAFNNLLLSLASIPIRPLCRTEAFDPFLEDALQASLLAMIEYLHGTEVGNPAHWQSLVGFVPMNARIEVACEARQTASLGRGRIQRRILREMILRPHLLDQDDEDLASEFPDESPKDVIEVRNALYSGNLDEAVEEIYFPNETADAAIDMWRLRDWVSVNLSWRHAVILEECHLSPDPMTYSECGSALGVSGERIRQLERELLASLREGYCSDLRGR